MARFHLSFAYFSCVADLVFFRVSISADKLKPEPHSATTCKTSSKFYDTLRSYSRKQNDPHFVETFFQKSREGQPGISSFFVPLEKLYLSVFVFYFDEATKIPEKTR